jgi:hypothetical protein
MPESLRFPLAGKPVGFMVWNPDRSMPTHVHDTFEDALAEAERLKRYAPRERFFVMAPVIDTLTVTYGAGFDAGRKAGLNEAHQQIMDAEARADRAMDRDGDRATQLRLLDPIFQKARDFQAIVADALLWFDGFAAAHAPKEAWERPRLPDRERLVALNGALQAVAFPQTVDALDDDIPF